MVRNNVYRSGRNQTITGTTVRVLPLSDSTCLSSEWLERSGRPGRHTLQQLDPKSAIKVHPLGTDITKYKSEKRILNRLVYNVVVQHK